jgi:hypothetical protein
LPDSSHRLHLLRPSPRVMFTCKIILISEWIFITTPNVILSIGAATNKFDFPYAYSLSQRIEPVVYTFVCFMLSGVYIYHAYVMFRRYRDRKIRLLLARLLYSNLLLIALAVGNVIAEYVGGGIIQTCYLAFFFSFVCLHYRLHSE